MTKTMQHPLLADFYWGALVTPLISLLLGTGGGGVVMVWLNHRFERQKQKAQGDATVEIASLNSLGDVQKRLQEIIDDQTKKFSETEARFDKKLGKLDRKLQLITTAYHTLWGEHKSLRQNWRTLTHRLKGTELQIDPSEFQEADIGMLDPLKLFAMMDKIDQDVSVHVFSSPSDPTKTTTITTTTPAQ